MEILENLLLGTEIRGVKFHALLELLGNDVRDFFDFDDESK
jgi:hypothetical protein